MEGLTQLTTSEQLHHGDWIHVPPPPTHQVSSSHLSFSRNLSLLLLLPFFLF